MSAPVLYVRPAMNLLLALVLMVVPTPPDQTTRLEQRAAAQPPVVLSRAELDARYVQAVSFIAPDVRVFCHTAASWAEATKNSRVEIRNARAFARLEVREAHLNPHSCASIDALVAGRVVRSMDAYLAVHALAHEAWHIAGVLSEAEADCRGNHSLQRVVTFLSPSRAAAVLRFVDPACR